MALTTVLYWSTGGVVTLLTSVKLWHWLSSGRCTSNVKLNGKTVIVTGANIGIGKETALELARRGACVIMACRDELGRGAEARDDIIRLSGNTDVHVLPLDLASLDSVRRFVQLVKQRTDKLHVLINNAAAAVLPNRLTEDGLQQEMQINHFGPFLLTILLIDLLKNSAPSRIVIVSALAHEVGKIELDNLNCEKYWPGDISVYSNTKLGNILFSNELARRLQGTGVTCNSLHPGIVKTELGRRGPKWIQVISNFVIGFSFKNAAEGAQTTIHLSVAEELENVTGKYFSDCKIVKTSKTAQDENLARALWDECVRLVKLQPHEALTD